MINKCLTPPVLHILNINCFIVLFAIYFYSIDFTRTSVLGQRTTMILGIIYSHYLYKLSIILISKLSKAQVCKWYRHKCPSPWGMPLYVVHLWLSLLFTFANTKARNEILSSYIKLCYTWHRKRRAINVCLALGSSRKNKRLMKPNVYKYW